MRNEMLSPLLDSNSVSMSGLLGTPHMSQGTFGGVADRSSQFRETWRWWEKGLARVTWARGWRTNEHGSWDATVGGYHSTHTHALAFWFKASDTTLGKGELGAGVLNWKRLNFICVLAWELLLEIIFNDFFDNVDLALRLKNKNYLQQHLLKRYQN